VAGAAGEVVPGLVIAAGLDAGVLPAFAGALVSVDLQAVVINNSPKMIAWILGGILPSPPWLVESANRLRAPRAARV